MVTLKYNTFSNGLSVVTSSTNFSNFLDQSRAKFFLLYRLRPLVYSKEKNVAFIIKISRHPVEMVLGTGFDRIRGIYLGQPNDPRLMRREAPLKMFDLVEN